MITCRFSMTICAGQLVFRDTRRRRLRRRRRRSSESSFLVMELLLSLSSSLDRTAAHFPCVVRTLPRGPWLLPGLRRGRLQALACFRRSRSARAFAAATLELGSVDIRCQRVRIDVSRLPLRSGYKDYLTGERRAVERGVPMDCVRTRAS